MSETKQSTGTCLCGKVKIQAKEMKTNLGVCHCGMCRKWSAGPFLAVDCGSDVQFEGEENIKVFVSSDWAERGFCQNCGTNIFWRFKQTQQHIISSELFDEPELKMDHQVYIDHKPGYYEFSNQTHNMTEAEVIAAYAPKD